MRQIFAVLAAFLCLLSLPVIAQQQSATTTQPPVVDVISVPVWPTKSIPLPEVQPAEAVFSLGRIEGVAPELLSGVTAKGYARKVTVENQPIGQVMVFAVAKGSREETIDATGLNLQFNAKETPELFPENTIQVEGSKTALIAALKRLLDEPIEKAKLDDTNSTGSNTQGAPKANNDIAAGYQSPTITPTTASDSTAEPVIEVRTTAEGCPVRIDMTQGRAFRQTKVQHLTNGAVTSEEACSDSEVSFPLSKSYMACPVDEVDLTAMKAWPQYQWFYIDDAGETHTVGKCTKDTDSPFSIVEDEKQCSIFLDFSTGKAVPQAALVYTNRNGATVQARGCADSTKTASITMTESVGNCPMRHDYGAGLTYELSMWTYARDGVTYQAAPCADTGRTFPHQTVYTDDSGSYICTAIINMTNRTATLQSRKRITVDGTRSFITECTPDTTSQNIQVTTDTCMDPGKWTHDINAGVSYGQERFYYLKPDASRVYVNDCQTNSTTYPHQVTVTGYQNNDPGLWAYPLSTIKILVGGSYYTVASNELLPGASQMVYVPDSTYDQLTGASTYEGCKAYRLTSKYERWKRPDNTLYTRENGAGTPVVNNNICQTSVIASGSFETGDGVSAKNECRLSGNSDDGSWYGGPVTLTKRTYFQNVQKTQTVNPETSEVVATACGFAGSWQGWSSTQSWPMSCDDFNRSLGAGVYSARQTFFVPPCPF